MFLSKVRIYLSLEIRSDFFLFWKYTEQGVPQDYRCKVFGRMTCLYLSAPETRRVYALQTIPRLSRRTYGMASLLFLRLALTVIHFFFIWRIHFFIQTHSIIEVKTFQFFQPVNKKYIFEVQHLFKFLTGLYRKG